MNRFETYGPRLALLLALGLAAAACAEAAAGDERSDDVKKARAAKAATAKPGAPVQGGAHGKPGATSKSAPSDRASPGAGRARQAPRDDSVVAEDGEVEAVSSLTVIARQRGQVTWIVPEHTVVEKGARVLELDHDDVLRELDDAEVSLKEAETQVSEQEDALADQKKELEAEVRAAESAVELSRFKLKILNDGPTAAARAQAKARVERSKAAYKAAETAFQRARELSERGVISRDEDNLEWVAKERARLDLLADELNWKLLVKPPEPVSLEKARLDIEVSDLELAVAKERLQSQLDALMRAIDEAKLRVETVGDRVRRLKRRIEQSVLRAPGPGLAEWGMVGHGRKRKIDIGARVWPGSALINLPDVSALKVSTQVGEEIVGSLRVGQRVPIEVIELEGRVFAGEILRIDIWGRDRNELLDDTGKRALGLYGAKVYAVDVKFMRLDPTLKRGSKARVLFPRPTRKGIER